MAISDITLSDLKATPTLRGNKLKATIVTTGPSANIPSIQIKTVIFYSSTTNNFATALEIARGNPEVLDAGLIEEQTYYYWAQAVNNSDMLGAIFPVSTTAGVACIAIGMSGLAFGLANGRIVANTHATDATVPVNALRIALKTAAGNDPSALDPIFVAFRNSIVAAGNYLIRQITSALSFTISAGSTLGTVANSPFRIWSVLFDDAGTLRLGVKNCSVSTSDQAAVDSLPESIPGSSNAEGGIGGADSAGVIYTGVAVASKAFCILGYLDWNAGLATPGTWSLGPNTIRLTGGRMKPGDVIQDFAGVDQISNAATANVIAFDTSIPQIGEGTRFIAFTPTPSSPCNFFDFDVLVNAALSTSGQAVLALFRDGAADAIASSYGYFPSANVCGQVNFRFRIQAASVAQRAFEFRIGPGQAGTLTINTVNLGGTVASYVRVTEIVG